MVRYPVKRVPFPLFRDDYPHRALQAPQDQRPQRAKCPEVWRTTDCGTLGTGAFGPGGTSSPSAVESTRRTSTTAGRGRGGQE